MKRVFTTVFCICVFVLFLSLIPESYSYANEGFPCFINEECGFPDNFCKKAEGDCWGIGICQPRPLACLTLFDPVCGCDGLTYPSECDADFAGVSVQYRGECLSLCSDDDGDGFYAENNCGTFVDCNDSDPAIYPGAPEVFNNGIDDNCNGILDDVLLMGVSHDPFNQGFCQTGGSSTTCNFCGYPSNLGQEFVASDRALAAVEIRVSNPNLVASPALTLNVRAGTISGVLIGSAVFVGDISHLPQWMAFHFEPPLLLTVGGKYVIEAANGCFSGAGLMWEESGLCSAPVSGSIRCGTVSTTDSFYFRTYTVVDKDGDGYVIPEDCDDNNPLINPAALEVCDGIDNNCNGVIDEWFDLDADGYTSCGGDCNDHNPLINPDALEICKDRIDNDCDGLIDRNDPDCSTGSRREEMCGDGIDNDGDGLVDCSDRDCRKDPACI